MCEDETQDHVNTLDNSFEDRKCHLSYNEFIDPDELIRDNEASSAYQNKIAEMK